MSHRFNSLLKGKKVLMVVGTGGVGKTTSAIAIALTAAKGGKKVALISIDPAKRLAAAIGLQLDGDLHEVKKYSETGGILDAMMLDHKLVFDALVKKMVKSGDGYQKIMENPMYQAASTKLAGTIEFMSLVKILEIYESQRYDLMVVDTPPDSHSIDFLAKPHILSSFHDHRVMQWVVRPISIANRLGLGKIIGLGEKVMSGLFQVTGLRAFQLFTDFLLLIKDVINGLHVNGKEIRKILLSDACGFLLVGLPNEASYLGMMNLHEALAEKELQLDGILLNKCLPEKVYQELLRNEKQPVFNEKRVLQVFLSRAKLEKEIKRRLKGLSKTHNREYLILNVSEKVGSIHSLETLEKF